MSGKCLAMGSCALLCFACFGILKLGDDVVASGSQTSSLKFLQRSIMEVASKNANQDTSARRLSALVPSSQNTSARRLAERTFEDERAPSCCEHVPEDKVVHMPWSEFESTEEAQLSHSKSEPLVVPCGYQVLVDRSPSAALLQHGLQVKGSLMF